jgi:hypothetical protein
MTAQVREDDDGKFWIDIRMGDFEERRGPYPDGHSAAKVAGICRVLFSSGAELHDDRVPRKRQR